MKTPLRAALLSLLANVALSLALMGPWDVLGLAAANGLAAALQTGYLGYCWRRERESIEIDKESSVYLFPIIVSTIAMSIVVAFGHSGIERLPDFQGKGSSALLLVILIPLAVVVHLGCLLVFSFPEVKSGFASLAQRLRDKGLK